MKSKSKLKNLLGWGLAGILVSSLNIDRSEYWQFNNPIPNSKQVVYSTINKDGEFETIKKRVALNKRDVNEILESRPVMQDRTLNLDFLGAKFPLFKIREVIDLYHNKKFSGFLDSEENIHTLTDGTYHLNSGHDSSWYSKE